MSDKQQLRRLSVVNGVTACLLALDLGLDSKFIPAICLLLMAFSFAGSVHYLTRGAAFNLEKRG